MIVFIFLIKWEVRLLFKRECCRRIEERGESGNYDFGGWENKFIKYLNLNVYFLDVFTDLVLL